MKLSQKVLIVLAGLIFFMITIYRFKYDRIVEFVPNSKQEKRIQTEMEYDNLKTISINGWFNVTIYKSESNHIKITGPGNLVGYYLKYDYKGDSLLIGQKIDFSKYSQNVNVTIGVTNLTDLKITGGAACLVKNFNENNFNLFTADSAVVVFSGCNYKNFFVNANNKSNISLSEIENCNMELKDKASLYLACNNGILSGNVSKEANLITNGKIKGNNVKSVPEAIIIKGEKNEIK